MIRRILFLKRQHELNNMWDEFSQKAGAIGQLIAIDLGVPGCPAVYQLVSKRIHTREDYRESVGSSVLCQGVICSSLGTVKAGLPVLL